MAHDSPAEVVSFDRFLERRQRRAQTVPPNDGVEPQAPTDPANAATQESQPRTTKTIAVARPLPEQTTR